MADNVQITAGSGTTVATDDVGSVHYQVVKIAHGADGAVDGLVDNASPMPVVQTGTLNVGTVTAVTAISNALPAGTNNIGDVDVLTLPVAFNAGAASATTPRVTLASDDPAVALLGTIDTDTGNVATSVAVMDDWDESDRAKVNIIVGQAGVAAGAGAVGATVPRVTLASDDPGVALLGTIDADTGDISTAVQIIDDWDESDRCKVNPIVGQAGVAAGSGAVGATTQRVVLATDVALPSGTNAIGKLAANSGVDIGDVDVTSVPTDPFGADADAASATGSISAKLRGIATALGVTALDLGSGTGGSRTLRTYPDTAAVHKVSSGFITIPVDITRENDTTAYTADDAWADDNGPTSGGFTLTNAARTSGGSGIITDAWFCTSADAATKLQAEMWLFNQSVTAIADNSPFAVSDSEIKTVEGVIPFTMGDAGNNGYYHAQNLNIGFTCSGSANLRFLVRVKNGYTPVSNEVLTCKVKIMYVD